MRRWIVAVGLLVALTAACRQRQVAPPPPQPPPSPAPPGPARSESSRSPAPADPAADATLVLPIPARAQAAESPPEGWCGETAIQEALLHLGMWAPQRLVNRAGHPVHPDLYATDIPTALTELGVRFSTYPGPRGFEPFARWARRALEAGDPVIAGVKILPTQHPDWGLDHFVLVVGHGPKGLLVNTTWGTRQWVGDTKTRGLSLAGAFYGIRLVALRLPPNARPARAALLEEGADTVRVRVTCTRDRGDRVETDVVVDAARPARFHCAP